jgi:hypothetical protein
MRCEECLIIGDRALDAFQTNLVFYRFLSQALGSPAWRPEPVAAGRRLSPVICNCSE